MALAYDYFPRRCDGLMSFCNILYTFSIDLRSTGISMSIHQVLDKFSASISFQKIGTSNHFNAMLQRDALWARGFP